MNQGNLTSINNSFPLQSDITLSIKTTQSLGFSKTENTKKGLRKTSKKIRQKIEKNLDEALKETFPASDAIAKY